MKLDAGEIEQLVAETERKRQPWARAADIWENDWFGNRYIDSRETKQDQDGVDVVVSPDPFNTIQLLLRFVAGEQRVEVPSLSPKEDDEDRSETMEEWLVAFDQESNRQQGRNHVNDMTVQSGVLARGATQILWVGDLHEEERITNRLPILRRYLDPRNVGVGRGAFGVDYAYHKYKTTRNYIKQMYPKYKLEEPNTGRTVVQGLMNEKYTVIDYVYRSKGSIYHAVVINSKFAKAPVKTDYPEVNIIEHTADGGPFDNELERSISILHPIHELWKMKCDIMSKVATGLMYHYDPLMIAKGNFTDAQRAQLQKAGPGSMAFLTGDQTLEPFSPQPNVPMAQALLAMIQTGIDQATFASSTYGDAPGGVTAGFAINSLAQSARARVNVIRQNIETAVEAQNQLILGLVEAFAPEDGVEVYGRSARGDRGKPLKLSKKIIKGNYANNVMLVPEQPMDDTQRILAWMQLVDKGIVSKELMRNRVINIQMPRDEEVRVAAEQALTMPELQQKFTLRAMQQTREQNDWEELIVATPLQALHEAEQQWREQKKAEAEQAKEARRFEQEQRKAQEAMMLLPPPMPPGMMGDPMQLPPGLGAMGGQPSMGGGSMPPEMMPPGMGMQPPGLPGLPPQAGAQFDPNALGLGGQPAGTMDMLLDGQPPSEEELLRQSGALPPQF